MSFPKIRITDAGKVLVAKALAGTGDSIKFTKFKIGSGIAATDETQWDAYTDLIQAKLSVNFTDYDRDDDIITLTGEFSNGSVATAFFWTELGIYGVQVDSSDNEGTETLIFYGNAGSLAEYVPASDAEVAVRHKWSTQLAISSAADVSAVVHSITYATAADLNAHIADTNNPHGTNYEKVGAPPKSHPSTTTEYGAGSGTHYGHLKLSNSVVSNSGTDDGVAATPYAVHYVRSEAQAARNAADDAMTAALLRGFPAVYGTYKGSGSADTGVTLTFDNGLPKLIFVMLSTSSVGNIEQTIGVIFPRAGVGFSVYNPQNNGGNYQDLTITTGTNTVNFKHASSTANGMKLSGRTYFYVAIM